MGVGKGGSEETQLGVAIEGETAVRDGTRRTE